MSRRHRATKRRRRWISHRIHLMITIRIDALRFQFGRRFWLPLRLVFVFGVILLVLFSQSFRLHHIRIFGLRRQCIPFKSKALTDFRIQHARAFLGDAPSFLSRPNHVCIHGPFYVFTGLGHFCWSVFKWNSFKIVDANSPRSGLCNSVIAVTLCS